MSARERLADMVRTDRGDMNVYSPSEVRDALDAHAAEVLAAAKVEVVAWLVKKAREEQSWDAGVLASKVDRGAVRVFLGTGHFRDAMDEHRAEVLAEVDQLLVAERMKPRYGDIFRGGVEHARKAVVQMADGPEPALPQCVNCRSTDGPWAPTGRRYQSGAQVLECVDGCAEKATAPAATATPFFEPGRTYAEAGDTTDWRFRCDSITTHPEDGERTALGWRHFRGEWEPYAYGEDDFEIHQIADDIHTTEGGAR